MLKIWVKIMKEQKIVKDFIYDKANFDNGKNNNNKNESGGFFETLREICNFVDIPTPLVLEKHLHHFNNFNQCKFKREEFIESISFDELVLENVSDGEKEQKNNL